MAAPIATPEPPIFPPHYADLKTKNHLSCHCYSNVTLTVDTTFALRPIVIPTFPTLVSNMTRWDFAFVSVRATSARSGAFRHSHSHCRTSGLALFSARLRSEGAPGLLGHTTSSATTSCRKTRTLIGTASAVRRR